MDAYGEFELDIPEIMREQLPNFFNKLKWENLTLENIEKIPKGAQGAYLLKFRDDLVYVGKTDAEVGFQNRLGRHYHSIQHRKNIDPLYVFFKAARIFVFSTFDLETMLIRELTRRTGMRPAWNFSGFGSNDPGRRREKQNSAKFDVEYPVDIGRNVDIFSPGEIEIVEVIRRLKDYLPYTFRYETAEKRGWRAGHPDMDDKRIVIPSSPISVRSILQLVLEQLPNDWQGTVLPNRVILYKENNEYQEQIESLRKAP